MIRATSVDVAIGGAPHLRSDATVLDVARYGISSVQLIVRVLRSGACCFANSRSSSMDCRTHMVLQGIFWAVYHSILCGRFLVTISSTPLPMEIGGKSRLWCVIVLART